MALTSARALSTGFPKFAEISPLARQIRKAARFLFQRVLPSAVAAERALAVEERVSIGPKKMLLLVRCRDQQFLVATAGDGVGPIIEVASRKTVRRSGKERKA